MKNRQLSLERSLNFAFLVTFIFFTGCGAQRAPFNNSVVQAPSAGVVNPGTPSTPGSSGGDSPYQMYALSWESHVPGSSAWSSYLFEVVLTQAPYLMKGSVDIAEFCPNYASISDNQKANFWAYLFSELALYESDYDPTSRYVETTLGTDAVTGRPVVSEGLLQMSYQDQLQYPFCQFDWATDSKLAVTDPNKTIFNPYINLACGALIMNQQIKVHNMISIAADAYWSTLEPSHSQSTAIKAKTRELPFCNVSP